MNGYHHSNNNTPEKKFTDAYLCVLEVMSPQWADFVLTADIWKSERAIVSGISRESDDVNSPQTVNEIFLYSTVSTLKPMVGIVVTISPKTRD